MRYYHVAGEGWSEGDDLLCRDRLEADGIAGAWAWDDAPEGFDGDVVCLYAELADAVDHRAERGGTIVAVNVPAEMPEVVPAVMGGYLNPRLTTVDEGFAAIRDGIPAAWLTIIR